MKNIVNFIFALILFPGVVGGGSIFIHNTRYECDLNKDISSCTQYIEDYYPPPVDSKRIFLRHRDENGNLYQN